MDILVYTRNGRISDLQPHMEGRFDGLEDRVRFRNASAHTEGDLEAADVVLVDDDFPRVAEEYRRVTFDGRSPEVELFRAAEVMAGYMEPPEPDGDLSPDAFASPTAFDLADEAGITEDDLAEVEPAGKTGYTTAQIRQLAEG